MTFGSTARSVPVVFLAPSVRPQTGVASEPAYVVGTATIGSPVVIATALASPVVEPPPTLSRASTPLRAAAAPPGRAGRGRGRRWGGRPPCPARPPRPGRA